jgi:hypothetical protein
VSTLQINYNSVRCLVQGKQQWQWGWQQQQQQQGELHRTESLSSNSSSVEHKVLSTR